MVTARPEPLSKRTTSAVLPVALLWLLLAGTTQAQELHAGCPAQAQPPDFVAQAVAAFAELKPHQTRWRDPLAWQQLLRELDRLRLDGLAPQKYFLSDLARMADQVRAGVAATPCQAQTATLALMWSLADLAWGRLDPQQLGLIWHETQRPRDPGAFARGLDHSLQSSQGLRQAYRDARPSIRPYVMLRAAYRDLRRNMPESWPVVPAGPTLRKGDSGPAVAALARRLRAQNYLPRVAATTPDDLDDGADAGFDDVLEAAVMAYQRDHGLDPDGLVGKATIEALNTPPGAWLARIRANLERLRWVAPYHGSDMLLVDIAGARVRLIRDGRKVWRGNAQVGRPERKTPALTSSLSHVTVNPTWTIPPTVFYEDTLPAIQADPNYLSRNRLTVLDRSGQELDPETVDWSTPGSLLLRQAAGPGNALGEVAIRFANPFAVYLHDTPSRWLFDTPDRFYSSGCVRVENAMELTDQLFRPAPEPVRRQLATLRDSGDTRNLSLPDRLPLVMAYWTAEADPAGGIRFRQDTYGEDRLVVDLLDDER